MEKESFIYCNETKTLECVNTGEPVHLKNDIDQWNRGDNILEDECSEVM